jgi:hypothetical protein
MPATTRLLPAYLVAAVLAVAIAGCHGTPQASDSGPQVTGVASTPQPAGASPNATPEPMRSAKAGHPTAINFCGPVPVRARYAGHTIDLAGCPGIVGGRPLRVLNVGLGATFDIIGLNTNYSTPRSIDPKVVLLEQSGATTARFVATARGTTTIEIQTQYCQTHADGAYCPALTVHVA